MGLLDEFYAPDYSKLKRGQFRQDTPKMREYAANVPVDVMRGRLAGLLGMFGDVVNQPSSFMPVRAVQLAMQGVMGQDKYPDTEHFLKTLPLAPAENNPLGRVAGQAGAFVPLTPMEIAKAARLAGRGATEVGKFVAPKAGQLAENYMQRMGMMPSIVPVEGAGLLGDAAAVAKVPNINEAEVSGLLSPAMPVKPMAEVSPLGFYSAVEQQALNIPRKSGTGASFINDLMKGQDVKKSEIEAMGLDEFLQGKPNVTRQEVQDFIAGNRIDVQERQLGGAITEDPVGIAQRKAVFDKYEPQIQALYKEIDSFGYNTPREVTQSTDNRLRALQEMRDAEANAFYKIPEPTPTKYDRFQLPGGENYREILLTLPEKTPAIYPDFDTYFRAKYSDYANPNNFENPSYIMAQRDAKRNWDAMGGKIEIDDFSGNKVGLSTGNYQSSHFDEPNILAHMRVNDRIDADGKKMLLVEEVQSDWHQAGREKGYNTPEKRIAEQKKLDDLLIERQQLGERQKQLEELASPYTSQGKDAPRDILDEWNSVSNKLQRLQTEQNRLGRTFGDTGVPDAPFKDTWYQLALKRAIKEAVDKGYDRIGLTTGEQQAKRFDLSKQIDKIDYKRSSNNTFELGVVGKNGETVDLPKRFYTAEELPSVLGKEVAEKIIKGEGQGGGGRMTLSGLDLKIGGEGMKKYYDEIYPKFLDKYGKKYGASVGETEIKTGQRVQLFGVGKLKTGNEKVRYLDITPAMRDAVKKGIPLAAAENITTGLLA